MNTHQEIEFIQRNRAEIEAAVLPASLAALFQASAIKYADKPFWIEIDGNRRVLSYRDFEVMILQYSASLRRFGIKRGTHVAVAMPNCPELGALWIALSRIGAVAIGVNGGLTEKEFEYVLKGADAEVLIADQTMIPARMVESGLGDVVSEKRIVIRGPQSSARWQSWSDIMSTVTGDSSDAGVDPDEMASMLYTSGSTGFPKPCMLPHRWHTMMGHVRANQGPALGRLLIDTPLYYMGGQWRFAMAMNLGATLCVATKPTLNHFLDRLLSYNIGFCYASAPHAKLQDDPRYKQLRLSWIAISGLPKELHRGIEERLGAPAREIYGSTELGSAIVVPVAVNSLVGSGSCGMPSAWRSCKIVDDEGNEVARGTAGELLVKGPGIVLGYYNRPDATADTFRDGWFRTGDLFVQDSDGYFYWKNRIKNIIRRSAQNISADEVEAAVRSLPEVVEVAAIPVPDSFRGEEVKVVVTLVPGLSSSDIPPEKIIEHCRLSLASFKLPRYIEYVDEFPRTSSNKISRQALRTQKADLRSGCFDSVEGVWC